MKQPRWSSRAKPTVYGFLFGAFFSCLAICSPLPGDDGQWLRPQKPGDPLIWGRKDGLVFGIPSEGGLPGPRGLIRAGIVDPKSGKPQLVNFIAIEPVVSGVGGRFDRMAFSELEMSQLDPDKRGKRLTVKADGNGDTMLSGELTSHTVKAKRIERLTVPIEVEPFSANKAHVFVTASVSSDHPEELQLSVYHHPDSASIEEFTVTATMGNYERLRWLWLKDRIIDSRQLYSDYKEDNFVEHENYPLEEMLRLGGGDAIALCTSNEASPSAAYSSQAAAHWRYQLPRLTQYWRVPAHDIEPDLRVRVNGRRVYWASHDPIPGGTAFENFEVRQRYKPGQTFIFGLTAKEPWQFTPLIPRLSQNGRIPEHTNTLRRKK